ncbi:ubiquinone biosynthesis protein COQ7-domain-containing protein [Umbelopsis sp. PMI_123]|nr:ubiquinone biosynthesis protein COQ7-domain-containing protein [Umbelopsis sp. PMI_123]
MLLSLQFRITNGSVLARTILKLGTASTSRRLQHGCYTTSNNNEPETPNLNSRKLTEEELEFIRPMIRVDQAGEIGANFIYMGQIAVLGKDKNLRPILQEMWDQEKVHLARFDELIAQHRVRPTLLRPLWEIAGFAVGAGTALMGKEAAMACTEAVETVIGDHYNDQLRKLVQINDQNKDLVDLSKTVQQFRDDELEHHDIAVEMDAQKAPFHSLLSSVIKQGCKTAIWVAERV